MSEKTPVTAPAAALEPQATSEPIEAGAVPTVYAILMRRFVDLLAAQEQTVAAAIDRELFRDEPPACVSSESIMRGMLGQLQRSTDTLVASDMAYNAVLRSQGRLARDAPSISLDIAHRVALAANLERETYLGMERWKEMDRWVYPKGVPETARATDWVAGIRAFAEDVASYLQREADQEPFMLLDGLAGIMKGLMSVLGLPELKAAFGAIEQEAIALPPPPAVPRRP